jgi:hypothetical protein
MNRGRWVAGALGATGVAIVVICAISLAPAAVAKKGKVPPCVKDSKLTWGYDESSKYPFRIWYPKGEGRDLSAKARYLKDEMNDHIWPRLTELMHTKPVADPQEICLVGDVGHKGSTGNTKASKPVGNPCDHAQAEILVLDSMSDQESRDVLAHEFMHALQFSLDVKCNGTWWWRESTGEWAEDFVYPHDNREHGFTKNYIGDMDHPLNDPGDDNKDREYGSWIFPFFIARELQPELISKIWHAAEDEPLMHAIDDTLPGGLKKQWKRFVLDAWNQDPVDDFDHWDDFTEGVHDLVDPTTMTPGSEASLDVGDVPHLAARYFSFKVGSGVRTLSLLNVSPYETFLSTKADPHASLQAIVDTTGSDKPEDWTGTIGKNYCFKLPNQHITKLTLIFDNSDTAKDFNDSQPARLIATNVGCASWHGTISGSVKLTDGRSATSTATVTFKRVPSSPDDPLLYTSVSGSTNWTASEKNCTPNGKGSWGITPDAGDLIMNWNLHNVPGLLPTRGYGGSIGGPLFYTWSAKCNGESNPSPHAITFGAWNSGPSSKLVSADGLHMTNSYTDTTADGTETWHWSLSSSG